VPSARPLPARPGLLLAGAGAALVALLLALRGSSQRRARLRRTDPETRDLASPGQPAPPHGLTPPDAPPPHEHTPSDIAPPRDRTPPDAAPPRAADAEPPSQRTDSWDALPFPPPEPADGDGS